jgi:hypothetical protein
MEIIAVFAMIGMFINDLLAILSVVGSTILLFGAFSKAPLRRYGKIADWSIVGLCMGGAFHIALFISGSMPDRIGFVFPMAHLMVSALFGISLLMLIGRWSIQRILRSAEPGKRRRA